VQVDGLVEGNVTARERVELNSKAKVKGDLVTARLVVADGASFVGHVAVGPEAIKSAKSLDLDIAIAEPKAAPAARVDGKAEPALAGRR
jgi:cytoskeletal protein CcmA (bactofilin family)